MDNEHDGPDMIKDHILRIKHLEDNQGRLIVDFEKMADKLSHIEAVLWGSTPERDGGLRKHLHVVEEQIKITIVWIRALTVIAAVWVLLFGPQRLSEIVKFFK